MGNGTRGDEAGMAGSGSGRPMRDEDEWLEWAGGLTVGVNFEPSATLMGLEGILAKFNAVLFSKDEEDPTWSCLSIF